MKETIKAMDGELERYHKSNASLDLTISNLKLKEHGLQGEVSCRKTQERRLHVCPGVGLAPAQRSSDARGQCGQLAIGLLSAHQSKTELSRCFNMSCKLRFSSLLAYKCTEASRKCKRVINIPQHVRAAATTAHCLLHCGT